MKTFEAGTQAMIDTSRTTIEREWTTLFSSKGKRHERSMQ
jgi:hypothetical protein